MLTQTKVVFTNKKNIDLLVVILVASIFTRGISSARLFGVVDFDYISYPFFICAFLLIVVSTRFSRNILLGVAIFLGMGFVANRYADYPFFDYLRYAVPIGIIYFTTYNLLRRKHLKKVFELYVNIATASAIFGIVQLLFKVAFGIKVLSNYSVIAIDSIALEPSHYVALIMPATIYSMLTLPNKKIRFYILLTALLLTMKLTAYAVLILMLIITNLNSLFFLVLILGILPFLYQNFFITNPEFAIRINQILDYAYARESEDPIHGTPLSLISNIEVALYSIKKNPLLGVGPGGHYWAYQEYFDQTAFLGRDYLYDLNARSGHSLSIRIASETGLIGFFTYIYLLGKNFINNKELLYERAISLGCISHFLVKSLKLGSYIDYGTPFFFCALLINWRYVKYKLRNVPK